MKRAVLLLFFSLFLASGFSSAQEAKYREASFRSYIDGKMDSWAFLVTDMSSVTNPDQKFQFDLLEYYYGLIGYYLDIKQNSKAESCLDKAMQLLKKLEKEHPDSAELMAIRSNFIGFQIALSPIKAPILFRSMLVNAKKAIAGGKEDPLVNILYANILFYMPDMFGGDSQKALNHYDRACLLMEQKPGYIENNWLYIQLLTTIGLVNEKLGNFEAAEKAYRKVIDKEPQYAHVKSVLYPRLLIKMKA